MKHLPSTTNDNVEMRLCKPAGSGSIPIEIVELYRFEHSWGSDGHTHIQKLPRGVVVYFSA